MFFGDALIERFETWGTVLLYAGYIIFSGMVIINGHDNITRVMATSDMSYTGETGIIPVLWIGVIYVADYLCVYPAPMGSLKRQEARKQCVVSGLLAGVLMTIPWFLTYFSLMSFYPSEEVLGAQIPWLVMMISIDAPAICSVAFGVVMGWSLFETSSGVIHALLGRINVGLAEINKKELDSKKQAVITVVILVSACLMSKFGIIALIEKGYTAISYAFMVLYLVPILTIGVYKILKKEPILKVEGVPAVEESRV